MDLTLHLNLVWFEYKDVMILSWFFAPQFTKPQYNLLIIYIFVN